MKDKVLLTGLVVSFFVIPFLPWQVLMLTDNILVRFFLLVGFLAAVGVSPTCGILALAVIGLLFIERNKAKMRYLKRSMQQSDMNSPAIQSIQTPETAPVQPAFEKPVESSVPFFPQEDSGDDMFYPVAKSMNEKQPLPTESSNGSRFAARQSFSWVNPALVQDVKPIV